MTDSKQQLTIEAGATVPVRITALANFNATEGATSSISLDVASTTESTRATSASIDAEVSLELDRDHDGLLDDMDNCPALGAQAPRALSACYVLAWLVRESQWRCVPYCWLAASRKGSRTARSTATASPTQRARDLRALRGPPRADRWPRNVVVAALVGCSTETFHKVCCAGAPSADELQALRDYGFVHSGDNDTQVGLALLGCVTGMQVFLAAMAVPKAQRHPMYAKFDCSN